MIFFGSGPKLGPSGCIVPKCSWHWHAPLERPPSIALSAQRQGTPSAASSVGDPQACLNRLGFRAPGCNRREPVLPVEQIGPGCRRPLLQPPKSRLFAVPEFVLIVIRAPQLTQPSSASAPVPLMPAKGTRKPHSLTATVAQVFWVDLGGGIEAGVVGRIPWPLFTSRGKYRFIDSPRSSSVPPVVRAPVYSLHKWGRRTMGKYSAARRTVNASTKELADCGFMGPDELRSLRGMPSGGCVDAHSRQWFVLFASLWASQIREACHKRSPWPACGLVLFAA